VDVCECHVAEVLGAVVIDRSTSASGGAFVTNNPLVPHDSWNSVDIILEHPLAIYTATFSLGLVWFRTLACSKQGIV